MKPRTAYYLAGALIFGGSYLLVIVLDVRSVLVMAACLVAAGAFVVGAAAWEFRTRGVNEPRRGRRVAATISMLWMVGIGSVMILIALLALFGR